MKSLVVGLALLAGLSFNAVARDNANGLINGIIVPPHPPMGLPMRYSQRYSTEVVEGREARRIWNNMTTPIIPGDSLRTFSSAYRVERSFDGREQTVCSSRTSRFPGRVGSQVSCTIQVSQDGLPLRPFVAPPRRLG